MPGLFEPFLACGILGRAVAADIVEVSVHDLRDHADNKWGKVDDQPYGGGPGMVIAAPPILRAVEALREADPRPPRLLMTSPSGRRFDDEYARELAGEQRIALLCGRYEGIDGRVEALESVERLSIGDYVLSGGDIAAMAIIEAVSRYLPGVVGDPDSVSEDSFATGLLDHPCFTRPPVVADLEIPDVLRSGNHEAIRRWRLEQAVTRTVTMRPDLIKKGWTDLTSEVRRLIRGVDPTLARACDAARKDKR